MFETETPTTTNPTRTAAEILRLATLTGDFAGVGDIVGYDARAAFQSLLEAYGEITDGDPRFAEAYPRLSFEIVALAVAICEKVGLKVELV